MRPCLLPVLILAAITAVTNVARANPEPLASYDARVAGMAGIAVTTVDNATAVYHNPAQLDLVPRFTVTAVLTSLLVNLRAPFAGAGSEQDSGLIYAPLFFVGAAGHIDEVVAIGFGAYVYTGFGGGFDNVGCISYQQAEGGVHPDCDNPSYGGLINPARSETVNLFVTEFSFAAQVSLAKNFSLGASLRIPWARQAVDATQEAFGIFTSAQQVVSGVGDPGVLVGLTYRPTPELAIGLTYRSKSTIEMNGTTETTVFGMPLTLDTRTTWFVPHMLRGGISYRFLNQRLLVSAEFKTQFHSTANQQQIFESRGLIANRTVADLNWHNVYVGILGFEYYVLPELPVRVGGTVGRSATNSDTITAFSPPPGVQYSLFGGIGLRADPIVLDLGFGWGGGPAHNQDSASAYCVPEAERPRADPGDTVAGGGCTGEYDVDSWFISLSATLNIE